MKFKILLILSVFLLPILNVKAQDADTFDCAFDTLYHSQIEENPQFRFVLKTIDEGAKRFRQEQPDYVFLPKPMPAPPCESCLITISPDCFEARYILPVLVHIVHDPSDNTIGQGTNITNHQVTKAIATLNKAFAGYGQIDQRAVNTGIQFYLAPKGPNSNGIIRYANSLTNAGVDASSDLMALIDPPLLSDKYIHIFIVNKIIPESMKGYASLPGMGLAPVVINHKHFGDFNDCDDCNLSPFSTGKTVAHELGHFLGLLHTFENGCSGMDETDCDKKGDRCCDTPPVASKNTICVDRNSCNETPENFPDQIENYMDYTPEYCSKWFTRNQAERMLFTLDYIRTELTDIDWLMELDPDVCLFSARFKATDNLVCGSGNVNLKAIAYENVTNVKYRWIVTDQSDDEIYNTEKTDDNEIQFFFDEDGKYNVSLQVSYDGKTVTETVSNLIWVLDCGSPLPNENAHWFFGNYAGLIFTELGAIPSLSAYSRDPKTIDTYESSVSVSNADGSLSFYGGGVGSLSSSGTLYNKDHAAFVGQTPANRLKMNSVCAQNALFIKDCPFDTVSILIQNQSTKIGTLYYTLLRDSLGYMVVHNNQRDIPLSVTGVLQGPDSSIFSSEALTTAPKGNGTGHWIAVITRDANFDAHLLIISLDTDGFTLAHSESLDNYVFQSNEGHYGQAKFSPDATKLAVLNHVFDFDRSDGSITKIFELPFPRPTFATIYGLSFSPNSRYLYWLGEFVEGTYEVNIYRINLALNDPLENVEKVGRIPNDDYYQGMQLGPDGRLYIAIEASGKIAVINHPDNEMDLTENPLGYEPYGVDIKVGNTGGYSNRGLPNTIDAKKPEQVSDTIYYIVKNCNTVTFSSTACCRTNYLWKFGDGDSLASKNAEHMYANSGVYDVMLILDNYSDTVFVKVKLYNPSIDFRGDSVLCNENSFGEYDIIGIDSFSSLTKIVWELSSGGYTPNPTNQHGIFANFTSFPAKIKVSLYDPLSGCSTSDSLQVTKLTNIAENKINYGFHLLHWCNGSGSTTLEILGNEVTDEFVDFEYKWYVSSDSLYWEEIEGETGYNLLDYVPDTSKMYFMRTVLPDACDNVSNIVKVIPIYKNNLIWLDLVPCKNLYNNYKPEFMINSIIPEVNSPNYNFEYKWEFSTNGTSWYSNRDWVSNSFTKPFTYHLRYIDTTPNNFTTLHARRVLKAQYGCHDTSNVIKVDNYYEGVNGGIEWVADSCMIAGKKVLEPTRFYDAIWEQSDNGISWTEITTDFQNKDTLWLADVSNTNNYRRRIIPLSFLGTAGDCEDIVHSVNYPINHPTNQIIKVGETANFNVGFEIPIHFDAQWQRFKEDSQEWEDMEGENETTLDVVGDLCNDGSEYRAILTSECRVFISDPATLTVNNPDPDYFLWLKDIPADTAAEPNHFINSNMYMLSPDIIVTHDPVLTMFATWPYIWTSPLDYYNGVYIHTIVRNKGTDTSRGGKLFLYAGLAGANSHWDFSFSNVAQGHTIGSSIHLNFMLNHLPPYNHLTFGTPVNTEGIMIPRIAPGDSVVITYHWDHAPVHFKVNSIRHPSDGTNIFTGKRTITYLARIENCVEAPHNMTHTEEFFPNKLTNSVYNNIRNNARIAAIHSNKLPMKGPRSMATFFEKQPDQWNLITNDFGTPYKVVLNSDSTDHFYNTAEMYVYFDQNLWDAFVSGGYQGSGYTIVEAGVFKIDTLIPVYWDNISLAKDSVGYIGYSLHYKPGVVLPTTVVNQMFAIEFYQNALLVGELFLHTQSQTDVEPAAFVEESLSIDPTQHSPLKTQHSIVFLANPNPFGNQLHIYIKAEENAVLEMYDMCGKVVASINLIESGEQRFALETANLAEGVFFVRYQSNTHQMVKKVVLVR
jgi:hypothetical protein